MTLNHIFQKPPASDWIHLFYLFLGIIFLILLSEIIRKKLHWSQEATRKIVHIFVGILLLLTPVLLETSLPLVVIGAFFTVFNFIALRLNLLPGIHIDRNNLGTVYYALSFLLLILLFWENYKIIIIAAMMVMAVGDAAAAIIGRSLKNSRVYILINDRKSLQGSLAMFLVSAAVIYLTFLLYPPNLATSNHHGLNLLLFAGLTALVATAAESLGDHGNDNFSVPLISAVILYYLLSGTQTMHLQFIIGMILGGVTAYLSFRGKFLTASGSITSFILACIIFGFGGWQWTLPILTFFILSSLLSKAGKPVQDLISEKGSQRDHAQVLANGGVAGILMILEVLHPDPVIYFGYLGALAAATADTWATEIGVRSGQQPRMISTFKPVVSGTSGGITPAGLIGALAGALILGLSGMLFVPGALAVSKFSLLILITLSGFFASLVDSLLGATMQVQFQCTVCQKITEKKSHCQESPTVQISGIAWLNNDLVNLVNTLSGAIFALVYAGLFFYN